MQENRHSSNSTSQLSNPPFQPPILNIHPKTKRIAAPFGAAIQSREAGWTRTNIPGVESVRSKFCLTCGDNDKILYGALPIELLLQIINR